MTTLQHAYRYLLLIGFLMVSTTVRGQQLTDTNSISDTPANVKQILERATFGSKPGKVDQVLQEGINQWLDKQLAPQSIDDSALQQRLSTLTIPAMTTAAILDRYPRMNLLTKIQERRINSGQIASIDETQSIENQEKNNRKPLNQRPADILSELAADRILRATYSQRKLQEVMVDFWSNHFNVYAGKGMVRWYLPQFDREVIRPHALGNFRDLLLASAKSPAMLFYLDNFIQVYLRR